VWGQVPRAADVQWGSNGPVAPSGASRYGEAVLQPASPPLLLLGLVTQHMLAFTLLLARLLGKALNKALNSMASILDLCKLGEGNTPSCTGLAWSLFNIEVLLLKIYCFSRKLNK